MSKYKLYFTLALMALGAFNLAVSRAAAQTQSSCAPDQRKQLILTAVDKDGNVIDKLRAEHLSLKVGGSPATISDVVFHARLPLDLAVLIDASASQETVLPVSKAAARSFAAQVTAAGQDRVAVVSFSNKPDYIQLLSSDLAAVPAWIAQVKFVPPPGYVGGGVVVGTGPPPPISAPGSTSLWDAIRSATQDVFDAQPENRHRVLLLFSDGTDTSSSSKLNPAIEEANKQGVAVFSIGMADSKLFSVDQENLKKVSEQTGGIARFPGNKKEKLEAALTEISRYLRGNYVIGYCGGDTKARARLQLEVVDPEMRNTKPVLAYKRY